MRIRERTFLNLGKEVVELELCLKEWRVCEQKRRGHFIGGARSRKRLGGGMDRMDF